MVPALCYPLAARISRKDLSSTFIALACLAWSVLSLSLAIPNIRKEADFYRREGRDAAAFVRDSIPAGSTVLIHDAGIVGWFSPPSRLIDVVGLKTPLSTAYHKRFTRGGCAWGEALDAIARDAGATHLVALQGVWLWPCLARNMEQQGWTLQPIREPIGKGYAVYKITHP